jgi:D-lactate dehydrogenase (quinone)
MSSMTTTDNKAFLNELARLVGHSHLLTDPAKTARYRKGFRSGQGDALAVVFPGSLLELWRVLKACVTADKIILMQAANTGLTEGSTPNGNDYDRDIVIISTLRLDKLHVLGKGEQVLAYPGTTLYSLEKALKPLGREPHSVIGSSCIGASVIGGICNNSGGSLVQRGPAYTEMSLFARINEDGKLTLVNHLGIDLGETPEQILSKLDDDRIKDDDVRHDGRSELGVRLLSLRSVADYVRREERAEGEALAEEMTLRDALSLFVARGCEVLPVVNTQGEPCGTLHFQDLLEEA